MTVFTVFLGICAVFFTLGALRCLVPLIIGLLALTGGLLGKSSEAAAAGIVLTIIYGVCFVVFGLLDWWVIATLIARTGPL